ncbi:hypothetical protein GRI97_11125 [Altererythrobacter xixiisoli]|uniref:HTH luxR-type domain-containing protein n=1 Tax=Croceibacterium xixiisoli TaxID=1476466 RepID=A0A6I4TWE7_9SPHN|nr:helix-turn-helix transcriptional regulator [Croceibacterium xixiisoli]MXO99539.1 hypothetical protein [Croceibacterium xixiisoli]
MTVEGVRALLHGAALGDGSWMDALNALAHATGTERGQLIGVGPAHVNFNWVIGFSAQELTELEQVGGYDPDINFRIAVGTSTPPYTLCHEGHYAEARKTLRQDIYLDYCERFDMFHGCQAVVAQDDTGFVGLATLRSTADGMSNLQERRNFTRLIPHVRHAVELQSALEGQSRKLLLGSFDVLGKAVLFLDRHGRCLAQTQAADVMLAASDTLKMKHGRPICGDQRDQAALNAMIHAVIARRTDQATAIIRRAAGQPLLATIHAFNPPETNIGFRPHAIVVLRHPMESSTDLRGWLRAMGLTEAEIQITLALSTGVSRADIADQRGATLGTVRQQIKAIYNKLGVGREAELVAMLGTQGKH